MLSWLLASALAAVLIPAALAVLRGCGTEAGDAGSVSQARAMQVRAGMSQAEVTALLGRPEMTSDEANRLATQLVPGLQPMVVPGGSGWTYKTREGGLLMVGFGPQGVNYVDLKDAAGNTLAHVGPRI